MKSIVFFALLALGFNAFADKENLRVSQIPYGSEITFNAAFSIPANTSEVSITFVDNFDCYARVAKDNNARIVKDKTKFDVVSAYDEINKTGNFYYMGIDVARHGETQPVMKLYCTRKLGTREMTVSEFESKVLSHIQATILLAPPEEF